MIPSICKRAMMALVGCVLLGTPSSAMDINGLWATDASVCGKVFVRDGNRISFRQDSDIYGSGFIIEGDRVRGQMGHCTIKSRRQEGDVIHMMLACASDIMLQNVQVSLKAINENSIMRLFPGMPDLSINYARCSL